MRKLTREEIIETLKGRETNKWETLASIQALSEFVLLAPDGSDSPMRLLLLPNIDTRYDFYDVVALNSPGEFPSGTTYKLALETMLQYVANNFRKNNCPWG